MCPLYPVTQGASGRDDQGHLRYLIHRTATCGSAEAFHFTLHVGAVSYDIQSTSSQVPSQMTMMTLKVVNGVHFRLGATGEKE